MHRRLSIVFGVWLSLAQTPVFAADAIEGDFPPITLLGMTFLQRVGMREENGALFLKQKF